MGLIEMFVKILKDDDPERKGMSTKDISKIAKKRGFWDPKGKTPQNTVSSTLSEFVKNSTAILRTSPGTYKFNDEISNLETEIKKKKPKKIIKKKPKKGIKKTDNYSDDDSIKTLKRKSFDGKNQIKVISKKPKKNVQDYSEEEDSNDSQDKNDSEYEDKKKYKPKKKKLKRKKKEVDEEEEDYEEEEEEYEEEEEEDEKNEEIIKEITKNEKKDLVKEEKIKTNSVENGTHQEVKKEDLEEIKKREAEERKKDFNDFLKQKFNEIYSKLKVIKHETCQICYKKCLKDTSEVTNKCNYIEENKNKRCDEVYHKKCLKNHSFEFDNSNFVCLKHFCNQEGCNEKSTVCCYFCTYSRCINHKEDQLLTYDSKVLCKNCEEEIKKSQNFSSILNFFK